MMPAPTAWPFLLALGVALMFAGLLTGAVVSVLGAGLYLAGAVGWFGELFPVERHELVGVVPERAPEVGLEEYFDRDQRRYRATGLVHDGQTGQRSRSLVVVLIMRCTLNGDDRGPCRLSRGPTCPILPTPPRATDRSPGHGRGHQ